MAEVATSAALQQLPTEGLLDVFCEQQRLLLLLGQTRQWTRMLRGQGPELQSVPGYFALLSSEQTAHSGPSAQPHLEPWHFDRFAEREGLFYAEGALPASAAVQASDFVAVSCLPREHFLTPAFLHHLLGFLAAVAERNEGDYAWALLWDGLLYAAPSVSSPACFLLLPPVLADFVAQRNPCTELLLPYLPPQQSTQGAHRSKARPVDARELRFSAQVPVAQVGAAQAGVTQAEAFSYAFSYALAVLFFRQVCGELPFAVPAEAEQVESDVQAQVGAEAVPRAQAEQDLRDFLAFARSSASYVPAALFCPALAQPWDALLRELLSGEAAHSRAEAAAREPALQRWQQVLQQAPDVFEGAGKELPCQRSAEQQQALQQALQARAKVWRRQRFWRRKRVVIGVCAGVFVLLAALVYTPLKRAIMPPAHSSWTALQVVEGYYHSLDVLDVQQHGELNYRASGVQKSDETLMTMLYVNSRTRRGYEGREVILPIGQWLEQQGLGQKVSEQTPLPVVSLDYLPYGISDLHIEKVYMPDRVQRKDACPAYVARYSFWLPGSFGQSGQSDDAGLPTGKLPELQPVHLLRSDRLTLCYHKDAWYVEDIQRKEQQVMHPGATPISP